MKTKKKKPQPKKWRPCGEDDNICNCKKESECGYLKMEQLMAKHPIFRQFPEAVMEV